MQRATPLDWSLFVLGLLALALGHFDFWRAPRAVLYFGWLPAELAWRLAWVAAAVGFLWFVCARLWKSHD